MSTQGPTTAVPRVDRRLAAILAADVVGYSRLMERDEAGTLDRLKAHRKELVEPLIAEHRGRIVKLMGDGALCEFASVVDAVACAVAIQRGMAEREADVPEAERIRFRIGINLGDVIVEGERHLRRWRERRRPPRAARRARRDRGLRHGLRPPPGRARLHVRLPRRAAPQEHRAAGQGLPGGPRRRRRGRRSGPRCRCPTGPRSRCCRSTTWAATRSRATSRTASSRTSPPPWRGSRACSSSPATRASPTGARPSTCGRSGASWACATCSRAASARPASGCASPAS